MLSCRVLRPTDDPASLGTEYLRILPQGEVQPAAALKASPENVFQSPPRWPNWNLKTFPTRCSTARRQGESFIFSRKQVSDDARALNDVHEAVTTVSEHVQTSLTQDKRLSDMENRASHLKQN